MSLTLHNTMQNVAYIATLLVFCMAFLLEYDTETRQERRWSVDPGRLPEDRLYKQMYRWRANDTKWKTHVGMTYKTYKMILRRLRRDPALRPKHRTYNYVPLKRRLLIVLHLLRTGCTQTQMEISTGVSQQTISVMTHQICSALARIKAEVGIYLPTDADELEMIAHDFESWSNSRLPGCVGAIDGTHIPYQTNDQNYINCKKFFSINVQAIVDAKMMFRDISANLFPGRWSDPRCYNWSYARGWIEQLGRCLVRDFNGTPVGLYVVADGAYALRSGIHIPYVKRFDMPGTPENAELLPYMRDYNYYHSSTRMVVEQAFGILKGRWRMLLVTDKFPYKPKTILMMVTACAVLHNICVTENDMIPRREYVNHGEGSRWSVLNRADALELPPHQGLFQGRCERDAVAAHITALHAGGEDGGLNIDFDDDV